MWPGDLTLGDLGLKFLSTYAEKIHITWTGVPKAAALSALRYLKKKTHTHTQKAEGCPNTDLSTRIGPRSMYVPMDLSTKSGSMIPTDPRSRYVGSDPRFISSDPPT